MFSPATREGIYARIGLCGPAKSGKSLSSLKIMRGLVGFDGKIAVLDTERRSVNKYVGIEGVGAFDASYPTEFSPALVTSAIKAASDGRYGGIIIDSLSHFWTGTGGALEQKDNAARRSGENSYTAWRDVTPLHNHMIDAMLSAPMHVIATMRTKTEYVLEEYLDSSGRSRTKPVKVGLAPIQRAGMEYEFDIVGDLDPEHNLMISGSRCPALDGRVINRPGEDLAAIVLDWLSGATPTPRPAEPQAPIASARRALGEAANAARKQIGVTPEQFGAWILSTFGRTSTELTDEELGSVPSLLRESFAKKPPVTTGGGMEF